MYTAAPRGVAPKFGRFLSGIGYLNDIHQHAWDFYDAPLVYQAFLGGQYQNNGLQVKWVAPTDLYVEFGGEIGSGEGFPGTGRNKNGVGNGNAYVHLGGDVGPSNSWRAGFRTCRRPRRTVTTPSWISRATTPISRSPGARSSRSPISSGNGRPTATRARRTSSCRASTSGAGSAAT